MATRTPNRNAEDSTHGEEEKKPLFPVDESGKGGVYDDQKTPLGDASDPRGDYSASQQTPSGDSSDPRGEGSDKISTPGDLKDAEASGGTGTTGSIGSKEKGLAGKTKDSIYNPADSFMPAQAKFARIASRIFTKKKSATGAVAVVAVTGLLFLGSIAQGPLQLMHLSQILQKTFSRQEDASKNRVRGLLRYARSGEVGETRVSFLGSRSVAKTNEKLKKIGITVEERSGGGGRPTSYKIDTSKLAPGDTTEKAALDFARANGIPDEYVVVDLKSGNRGGTAYVRDPDGKPLPAVVDRAVNGGGLDLAYKDKKMGRIMVAMKGRQVSKFNGSYRWWHPFKKFNVWSMEKADAWDKARKAKNAERSAKAKARAEKIKTKLKPAAGPVAIASGVQLGLCLAKDVAHATPLLTYENVRQPAKNAAQEVISMGDQIRAGDDFHITQPGTVTEGFKDKDGNTIWGSKALNALENGGSGKGQDLEPDVKSSFSSRSTEADIESYLNAVGGEAICSTTGQIVGGAVGLAALVLAAPTGGGSVAVYSALAVGSTAITVGAVTAVTTLVPKLLADKPLVSDLTGPFGGSIYAFGAQDMANDNFRKAGGVEMSDLAAKEIEQKIAQEDRNEFKSKSFFERTFNVYDYRSVASRTIDMPSESPTQLVTNTASSVANINIMGTKLLNIFTPKLHAQEETYDWGFPKYGFTKEELEDSQFQDPYENAEEVANILDSNNGLTDRAKKCFGVELTKGSNGWQVGLVDNPDADPEKEVIPSTADYKDANCADQDLNWKRLRFFIFDSRVMDSYSCYDGDQEACTAMGIESGGSTQDPASGAISNGDLQQNKDKFTEILKIKPGYTGPAELGFYHQCQDERWSSKQYPYAGGGGNTVCASACGPSSLAMVVSNIGNKIINPYEMGLKVKQYHQSGGTAMSGAVNIVKDYGLTPKKISGNYSREIKDVLSSGGLVIMNANPSSPFTQAGHFIVIRGISKDGTKFIVADPADDNGNGQNRNSQEWPMSSLSGWLGPDGLWGITK